MTDRSREGDQETAGGVGSEVPQRPVRRRFDAAYKLRILEEAAAHSRVNGVSCCGGKGSIRPICRRGGSNASRASFRR